MTRKELREATCAVVNAVNRPDLLNDFGISRVGDLTGLDAVGLPVHMAVRVLSKAVSIHAGKGLIPAYSRCGAIMEAIEFHVAERPAGPFRIASANQLPAQEHLALQDCFPTRSSVLNDFTLMAWEEVVNIQNGTTKMVPSDLLWLVGRITAPLAYIQMGSNGLASGGSLEDAILAGLYEIIERDAWTLSEYLQNSGMLLTRSPLTDAPEKIETCVQKLEAADLRLHLFDITTDYNVPVFCAIILDLSGRCAGTFGGYGCHLNAEIAAVRAITEAAQARCCYISGARDDLFRRQFLLMKRMNQEKLDEIFNQLPAGSPLSDYRNVNFPDVRSELRYLLKLIKTVGINEVFVKEMGSYLNGAVHVVRVFSPQTEPFRFDHWSPSLRCLKYAERKINALAQQAAVSPNE